ncbi:MAG: MBL fold metallo-hydrolase [Candidatus Neomarinimicrobiota bacterium]
MKIGEYELYSIITSEFRLDGGAMFGIIPKPLWERKAPADDRNRIKMVTRSLLLVNDKRRILVDTGNGNKWQEKFREIYEIDTSKKNLDSSLARVDLTADDITDVLCTHLHFDHAGGNTSLEEERIIPTFPNAVYWIQNENWKLANSPSEKDQGSFMEADWAVLAENNMINLVDGKETFIPGIGIILTYGHTTGQMHPLISDERKTLLYCGDLIPMSAHIPLPWVMAYDIHPVVTVQEKKIHLPRAVDENWILFFEHDPELQACTVQFDGKHYKPEDLVTVSDE